MNRVIDRVPTYAGRIQLIPVDADKGIYDMVRADEPTVVGTPINAELFDSIAEDLEKIAPPIFNMSEKVANSKNVAFYTALGEIGLESDAEVTTTSFLTSTLPLNSCVLCSVASGDSITLTDLPSAHGTLLLMKGDTSENRSGIFCPKTGGIYVFSNSEWIALVLATEPVYTTELVIDWEKGTVMQTKSDGTTRTANITFDAAGLPTKIGNMALYLMGCGA